MNLLLFSLAQLQSSPFSIKHQGFDGKTKTSEQLYDDVIRKLQSLLLPEILKKHSDKILFAVCIHTIECWLLPLCYTDKHKTNTNNCLETLNMALRKQDKPTISPTGKNNSKGIKAYDTVLRNLKRKSEITDTAQHNFGFYSFIQSLSAIS